MPPTAREQASAAGGDEEASARTPLLQKARTLSQEIGHSPLQAVLPSRTGRVLIRQHHPYEQDTLAMIGMADEPDELVEKLVISLD